MLYQIERLKKSRCERWLIVAALVAFIPLSCFVASAIEVTGTASAGLTANGAAQGAVTLGYSPGIRDVLKMVDAKVDVTVITAYIKNSPTAYNPNANEIIALKQHGVGDDVVTTLIQRGGEVRAQAMQQGAQTPAAAAPAMPSASTGPYGYGAQQPYPYADGYPAYHDYAGDPYSYYAGYPYYPYYPYYYSSFYNYGYPWWPYYSFCWPHSFCFGFNHFHNDHFGHHGGIHATGPGSHNDHFGHSNGGIHATGPGSRTVGNQAFNTVGTAGGIRSVGTASRSFSMPARTTGFVSGSGGFRSAGGLQASSGAFRGGGGGFHGGGGGGFHGGGGGGHR